MNFEINVYFAKFLVSPRYMQYITNILQTEMKEYPKIDVRFYAYKMRFWDKEELTPEEAIEFIKGMVEKLSTNLKPEVRQDFIDDFVFQGHC